MQVTITFEGAGALAIMRAADAYNARNPVLSHEEFLQRLVRAQVDALVTSYVTTKVRPVDFLQRFTPQERTAVRSAAKTNPAIDDYLQMLAAVGAGELDLTHELTVSGVQALEAAGLIATGRAAQILSL